MTKLRTTNFPSYQRFEGGHQYAHDPCSGTCDDWRSTCVKREANAAAYLRAAHAYMLISMPTDTSTIFGVFQAIVALHFNSDEIRPTNNLTLNKKFASEIFLTIRPGLHAASQYKFTIFCDPLSKQ
jgi:hypothetical protein